MASAHDGPGHSPPPWLFFEAETPTPGRSRPAPAWHPDEPTVYCVSGQSPFPRPAFHIAGYEILGELGRGGMGVIYKARHIQLKRLVAIKMILAGSLPGSDQFERFQREAEAVARLQHPRIVQIYEFGEQNGCPFFSLELVEGPNLAQALAGRPVPPRKAARLVQSLAETMHYAHLRGIVHRDLKPGNVLLASGPSADSTADLHIDDEADLAFLAKVTDFGLAKLLDTDAGLSKTGNILGTPSYMAPEQAMGRKESIGPATDVYALGAILYEALTGQPPFMAETAWDTMVQVAAEEPIPPSRRRPGVPAALERICLKALAKDPTRRYPSAQELADDLHRFCQGETVQAKPTSEVGKRLGRAWRHPLAGALLLALVIFFSGAVVFTWSSQSQRLRSAEQALAEGRQQLGRRQYAEAVRLFSQGLEQAVGWPELLQELQAGLQAAKRGQAAQDLHRLADQLRFLVEPSTLTASERQRLEQRWRDVWKWRDRLVSGPALPQESELAIRTDLLDMACIGSELRRAAGGPGDRQEAERLLDEAEALWGASLARLRKLHAGLLRPGLDRPAGPGVTAWDYHVLGRAFLQAGELDEAAWHFERAVQLQPQGFWPQFYRGVCAFRRARHDDARSAFDVCIALAPESPWCFYHRGLVHGALDQLDLAARDYTRALTLDARLTPAWFNRGLVHFRNRNFDQAQLDLKSAFAHGADPVRVHYQLALIYREQKNVAAAREAVRRALQSDPAHAEALRLQVLLEGS